MCSCSISNQFGASQNIKKERKHLQHLSTHIQSYTKLQDVPENSFSQSHSYLFLQEQNSSPQNLLVQLEKNEQIHANTSMHTHIHTINDDFSLQLYKSVPILVPRVSLFSRMLLLSGSLPPNSAHGDRSFSQFTSCYKSLKH